MSKKQCRDWTFEVPWGKLALVSWGKPINPPVLMVHGMADSAATFIPLVEELPDHFFYVGVDLPGNGKSDAFPPGVTLNHGHMVEVIRRIVIHMKWDNFVYMSHSLGFLFGIYYNVAFPGRITKMISFDHIALLSAFYHSTYYVDLWSRFFYTEYYENYNKFQSMSPKTYTYDQAVSLMAKVRGLSKSQVEIIVSRILVPVGNDRYRLARDEKFKRIAGFLIDKDSIPKIILNNAPSMLNIVTKNPKFPAYIDKEMVRSAETAREIDEKIRNNLTDLTVVVIDAAHDLHITHAAEIAPHVARFLNKNCNQTAKL